jgi:hypothetical protein
VEETHLYENGYLMVILSIYLILTAYFREFLGLEGHQVSFLKKRLAIVEWIAALLDLGCRHLFFVTL